jgi:ABC-2 type transport system ATP-binding protein
MEEADSLCQRVAIMHLGNIMAMDTPEALKASVGESEISLDDVFTRYTGNVLETGGTLRDTAHIRRAARRLS